MEQTIEQIDAKLLELGQEKDFIRMEMAELTKLRDSKLAFNDDFLTKIDKMTPEYKEKLMAMLKESDDATPEPQIFSTTGIESKEKVHES